VWHAKDYDDKLTAGTPIVTVIPIRRKDMVREAKVRQITEKENYNNSIMERKQASRASVYTNEMRVPKK
jgi:hypothetical protein